MWTARPRPKPADAGFAYTYQWVRVDGGSESDISGATSKTYTTVAADEGKTLKVRVTFVDDAGNPEGPLTSAATATVAAVGNATGAPTISGVAQVGQVLTASTAGISDPDGKTRAEAGRCGLRIHLPVGACGRRERERHIRGDVQDLHAGGGGCGARPSR